MSDFLLELRSEEIPARMQARAREDLARLFAAELAKAGLGAGDLITYSTPRRLALIARDLPETTPAVREEIKGPRASAPAKALDGFLRKTGLTREALVERDGVFFAVMDKPGRATIHVLTEAIPAIIRAFPWPKSMRWGAASISTASLRWVRPLHGIVALLGDEIVPVEIAGVTGASSGKVGTGFPSDDATTITSSATTLGHRFHHPGAITIGSAADYVEKLRACHVIVDHAEREALIRTRAAALAAEAGLALIEDEGLVVENAGLTEWPVPLLGRFDADFLSVPPEVIQLTARVNQKYFVCRDGSAALASAFICTANIDAIDRGAAIVEGNRKVLAARLSDARFFYEADLKVPLAEQAKKLDRIVFHEKLGTVADKVERVAKLARWLVEEGIVNSSPFTGRGTVGEADGGGGAATRGVPSENPLHPSPAASGPPPRPGEDREELACLAERAALLCKADLVTGMVGEFPELQGVMGGYYAAAQGEPRAVSDAIRDHYKPVGQSDDVPTAPVTVAVSLADKLDTITGFFGAKELPSGSRDPFALRRAALATIRLVEVNGLRISLGRAHVAGVAEYVSKRVYAEVYKEAGSDALAAIRMGSNPFAVNDPGYRQALLQRPPIRAFVQGFAESEKPLLDFFADRLKVQQREAGVRHDLIDAVFALGGEDDLVRLLARVRALQAFVGTEDGANLLVGYRRAANILKKEGYDAATSPRHPGLEPGSRLSADEQGSGTPGQARGDDVSVQSSLSYTPESDEAALIVALDAAAPRAAHAVAAEDFEGAMAALASLRAPIDAFFETVTVNDPAPAKRLARLTLLARVRDAVHAVADFSRIEG